MDAYEKDALERLVNGDLESAIKAIDNRAPLTIPQTAAITGVLNGSLAEAVRKLQERDFRLRGLEK